MKYGIALTLFIPLSLFADRLTIHNKTNDDIYIAQYYVIGGKATRGSEIKKMEQQSSTIQELLKFKPFQYRELAFVSDKNQLTMTMTENDFKKLNPKNVGIGEGNSFYIAKSNQGLTGYNTVQWNAIKPAIDSIEQQVDDLRRSSIELLSIISRNPYRKTIAHARVGNELSVPEQRYRNKRTALVKKNLEKLLNKKIEKIPHIALVCSGGGVRAMLSSLGALHACYTTGLYNVLMYLCALSGSTWMAGSYLSSDMALPQFKDWMVKSLQQGLAPTLADIGGISNVLLLKKSLKQPLGMVDLYGALLANTMLGFTGSKRQTIKLSNQTKRIEKAQDPFPIYTAIHAQILKPEEWYEFTPYEIGSVWQGIYIPTWAFGRRFENGASVDFAPEQSFGFGLGIFGSAFAATARKIYKEYIESNIKIDLVRSTVNSILEAPIGEVRPFIPGYVYNYMKGMKSSKTPHDDLIGLADAGLDFNLPYPPISGHRTERKADIIIFIDASSGTLGAELVKVEQYARKHNLKFPIINYTGIEKKAISIFKDKNDSSVPVVIYMPLVKDNELWNRIKNNPKFEQFYMYLEHFNIQNCIENEQCGTFNFVYNEWQARQMAAVMECNVKACSGIILDEIAQWITKRTQ